MSARHDTTTVNSPEDGMSPSGNTIRPGQLPCSCACWKGANVFLKIAIILQVVCSLTVLVAPEVMAKSNDHQFQEKHRPVPQTVMVHGGGMVTSFPEGFSCCGGKYPAEFSRGTVVKLQAEPGAGHFHDRWRGACRGSKECQVRLKRTRKVMAAFQLPQLFPLRVIVKGEGRVTSSPKGLECSNGVCFGRFPKNSVVILTAIPGNDQTFKHWGGACLGGETCRVTLKRSRTVLAKFTTSPSSSVCGNGLLTNERNPPRDHSC